ncbi:GNAT family N-acetyltransferase [Clostridium hydrogeniformans]|uniref:GNAT family N-acetyltransferase n=1 Tax=Clostridium hydrogeniformans TaxID=349933 RepID=UPI000485BE66|nr:GNAT family protein [Clostridium hydrogeniformans]
MIIGKEILIRPLEIGDEEYLYKWWNDEDMMSHAGFAFGTLESKEAIRLNVLKSAENSKPFSNRKLFILCRKEDLKPIGEMNYSEWDIRNQKCEIGIKICENLYQGKGYGVDALYHFIDFLFRYLNLNKVELTTMEDNKRAHNLYEKLGFKEIGIIRKAYFDSRRGEFSNAIYMDILKEEWMERKDKVTFKY